MLIMGKQGGVDGTTIFAIFREYKAFKVKKFIEKM